MRDARTQSGRTAFKISPSACPASSPRTGTAEQSLCPDSNDGGGRPAACAAAFSARQLMDADWIRPVGSNAETKKIRAGAEYPGQLAGGGQDSAPGAMRIANEAFKPSRAPVAPVGLIGCTIPHGNAAS